ARIVGDVGPLAVGRVRGQSVQGLGRGLHPPDSGGSSAWCQPVVRGRAACRPRWIATTIGRTMSAIQTPMRPTRAQRSIPPEPTSGPVPFDVQVSADTGRNRRRTATTSPPGTSSVPMILLPTDHTGESQSSTTPTPHARSAQITIEVPIALV